MSAKQESVVVGAAVDQRVRTPPTGNNCTQKQTTSADQNGCCNCPTSLHTVNESITRSYSQCPVCLSKFDTYEKLPIALKCSHTICLECGVLLIPKIKGRSGEINKSVCLVNYPLLAFLDYKIENHGSKQKGAEEAGETDLERGSGGDNNQLDQATINYLCNVARLIKSHTVSRSIHRKTIVLINSIGGEASRVLKSVKCLGERALVELTSSCAHVSHYHAQQQLWAAIRARACQFMGPAMQDEALRLVLLALEDGSALSRKVLVMFVVQRLGPQFPQASKTSVGHIVQLLYRASAFDVLKRQGNSSLMTLRPEFRNYEALRREHDTQIMKIGLEAGIRFTPEQWSSLLYGDTGQKPLMQSIIDKLQSPQTFQELLKEYLVSVQRLSTSDSQFLVSLHTHFKVLSMIEIGSGMDDQQAEAQAPISPEKYLPTILESLYAVLYGLITFTANRKHQRTNNSSRGTNGSAPHHNQPQHQVQHHLQQQQNNNNGVTPKYGSGGSSPPMMGMLGKGVNNAGFATGGGSKSGGAAGAGIGSSGVINERESVVFANSSATTANNNNNNLVSLMQATGNLCIFSD